MNLWKYYDGDLKYPDITKYSHEKEIAKSKPKWAFKYVLKHGKDEELEPIIAKSAYYSYQYANDILKGPFKLGEKAISTNAHYSYEYAILLEKRFPAGEPVIAKDANYSLYYAQWILKKAFPLGEPAIAKNTEYSKEYTQEVLKKDFILNGKLICKYKG